MKCNYLTYLLGNYQKIVNFGKNIIKELLYINFAFQEICTDDDLLHLTFYYFIIFI